MTTFVALTCRGCGGLGLKDLYETSRGEFCHCLNPACETVTAVGGGDYWCSRQRWEVVDCVELTFLQKVRAFFADPRPRRCRNPAVAVFYFSVPGYGEDVGFEHQQDDLDEPIDRRGFGPGYIISRYCSEHTADWEASFARVKDVEGARFVSYRLGEWRVYTGHVLYALGVLDSQPTSPPPPPEADFRAVGG
jgi:hypothetical protein